MKIAKRKPAITLVPEYRSRRRAIYIAVSAREKWSLLGYMCVYLAMANAHALVAGEPIAINGSWTSLGAALAMLCASVFMWRRRSNEAHDLIGEP